MLFVQFWINSTRDVWKFCQIGLAPAALQFWQHFQTSLVLLIPNFSHNRMITYTETFVHFDTLYDNKSLYNHLLGPRAQ